MLNLTLMLTLLALACGEIDDAHDAAGDGGASADGGGTASGTAADGGATTDGGAPDGGSDTDDGGACDGGAEGYGVCELVSATLDDYTMELDHNVPLNRLLVEPVKGESCSSSVWVDNADQHGRFDLAIYFQSSDLAGLDGARARLKATSFLTKDDDHHEVAIYNNWEGNEQGLVLVDHPEVSWAYMDGEVTWNEVDSSTARLDFTTLCWPDNPRSADPDEFSCQSFEAAWLEFNCEYTSAKAGPVGVSSWVTGADGETLCTMPD